MTINQTTSLFSVQGKICLVLFHGFCAFVLRHLRPVQEVNAQTPSHPLQPFITRIYRERKVQNE